MVLRFQFRYASRKRSLAKILKPPKKIRTEDEARMMLGIEDGDRNPYVKFQVEMLTMHNGSIDMEFMLSVRNAWDNDSNRRDDLVRSSLCDYSKHLTPEERPPN